MAKKLVVSVMNGAWQVVPAIGNMAIAAIVVRLFSPETWGAVVELLVWQQIANGVLNWGNRDFLQRLYAQTPRAFQSAFASFFVQRLVLLAICGIGVTVFFSSEFALVLFGLISGRYVVQSFFVYVTITHKFGRMVAIEFIGIGLQISLMFWVSNIQEIFMVLLAGIWLKALLCFVFFKMDFKHLSLKTPYLKDSFYFAMIGISGLFLSKLDILAATKLLSLEQLGQYQIILLFLLNLQSGVMIISGPFIHHFYRSNEETQTESNRKLRLIGLPLVLVGLGAVQVVLQVIYGISFKWSNLFPQIIICVMPYLYIKWIYKLNEVHQEHSLLWISLIGVAVLALLFWFLSLQQTIDINRFFWVLAVHQSFMLGAYYFGYTLKLKRG
jgi:hypothetical protein